MAIDEEVDRALENERPGPEDLETALSTETLSGVVRQKPLVLDQSASLFEAIRLMQRERRACVLLVSGGRLTGIFTERDVLMKLAGNPIALETTPIGAFMTADPVTLPADASVAFALNLMVLEGFRHVPLVDDEGRPQAVVSMRNLIEFLSDFYRRDLLTLPPDPRIRSHARDGA